MTERQFTLTNVLHSSVFFGAHLMCFAVIWCGVSWIAALTCALLYFVRMFGITGGYHRYFSHRTYKTSRAFQFILALIGCSAGQKGPLWWAAHHRHHHRHSDTPEDLHSPGLNGLWWAHIGWVLSTKHLDTNIAAVKDLAKFPELRFLNEYHHVVSVGLAVCVWIVGHYLGIYAPGLHTDGFQMLIWGYFISTVMVYHATFCINSLTHLIGRRRFKTTDDSRNSFILALICMGEGWHNNHHRYPGSEQQGFYWWEIDLSHYVLKFLALFGIVWDIRTPPEHIYEEAAANKAA